MTKQSLREAQKFTKMAREHMTEFWRYLLIRDTSHMIDSVASMQYSEEQATEIFENLRTKFPKSAKVA